MAENLGLLGYTDNCLEGLCVANAYGSLRQQLGFEPLRHPGLPCSMSVRSQKMSGFKPATHSMIANCVEVPRA